jgi:GT2 family glycosyltransferase
VTSPWLSVLMPVHAGSAWLAETLESVAGEPHDGVELVILDSTPDDSCERIARAYEGQLSIRYRRTPEIVSWTAKTNLAAREARGPYLSMLHQDDLWLSGRIADVQRATSKWPAAILFLNPSRIIDDKGRSMGLWRCPLPADILLEPARLIEHLLVQNFVAIPAPVISRQAWLDVGGMDDSLWYTADWDLYLKLASQGVTIYSDVVTTAFRIHHDSLTVRGSRDDMAFRAQMDSVIDRHALYVPAESRARLVKTARASATVNAALAAVAHGQPLAVASAAWALMTLRPTEVVRYLRDSRLHERLLPRVRAKLAGSL